jgi:hypothetical protein
MPPTSPNLVIFIVDGEGNHAHGTSGGWPSEGLSDMETTEAKAKDAIACCGKALGTLTSSA